MEETSTIISFLVGGAMAKNWPKMKRYFPFRIEERNPGGIASGIERIRHVIEKEVVKTRERRPKKVIKPSKPKVAAIPQNKGQAGKETSEAKPWSAIWDQVVKNKEDSPEKGRGESGN